MSGDADDAQTQDSALSPLPPGKVHFSEPNEIDFSGTEIEMVVYSVAEGVGGSEEAGLYLRFAGDGKSVGVMLNAAQKRSLVRQAVQEVMEPRPHDRASAYGRNSPCPCGSGKKFKSCHGAAIHQTRKT